MQSSPAVLGVETEPPRYNMRRTTSRPNPPPHAARTRGLAKPQAERTTLVQAKPNTKPGSATQPNEVVVALAQAAAAVAVAEEVGATQPEPPVAAVDLKHADLQQLVSSDLLLSLMPEAEPENAGGEHLDVKSGPVGAAGASPLDATCVGRTSPTDVISAAGAAWSVPSPSCAETLTPILAPCDSEQYTHWTSLVAQPPPKTVAPTPPASPLRPVAHSSTRKIRTVAWEEHSKPKHVLDEVALGEGKGAASRHVLVAANPDVELPWSFWQARHSGSAPSGSLTSSPPLLAPSLPPPPPSTSPPCPTPSPHLSPGEHR